MRVLVCSDELGGLASAAAGRALADGWAGRQTAVVPVGEAGAGFLASTADRLGAPEEPVVVGERVGVRTQGRGLTALALPGPGTGEGRVPYAASSLPLGRLVGDGLPGGGTVFVDLVSDDVHDGGAGLLAALGAEADVDLTAGVAGLAGLGRLDLTRAPGARPVSTWSGSSRAPQLSTPLLGLRGITSVRGRAAGEDAEPLLAADASLQRLADLAGPGLGAAPGPGPAAGPAWPCSRSAAG